MNAPWLRGDVEGPRLILRSRDVVSLSVDELKGTLSFEVVGKFAYVELNY